MSIPPKIDDKALYLPKVGSTPTKPLSYATVLGRQKWNIRRQWKIHTFIDCSKKEWLKKVFSDPTYMPEEENTNETSQKSSKADKMEIDEEFEDSSTEFEDDDSDEDEQKLTPKQVMFCLRRNVKCT